jgi:hypothetical protein
MTRNQIIALQSRIGTTADGFWGPKSLAACQRHLRSLMPLPHPWPKSGQAAVKAFYGDPAKGEVAERLRLARVDGLGLRFAGKDVNAISAHRLCIDSLVRVLREISLGPHASILSHYAGIYNHRPMRGGTNWSLHAYGAAIDLKPQTNGLHTHWPTRADMPIEIMEAFAREGWLPAGAFWSRDAMHFQATQ